MHDILIKNAKIFPDKTKHLEKDDKENGLTDIAINDGFIIELSNNITAEGKKVINADGRVVLPGFIDSHMHLVKALTYENIYSSKNKVIKSLDEAIEIFAKNYKNFSQEDIYSRGKKVLEMAVSQGTIAIRSHVSLQPDVELKGLEPLLKLKNDFDDLINLQLVAFITDPLENKKLNEELYRKAVKKGVDAIGGCPYISHDHQKAIDFLFKLGKDLNMPLDLHVDESDSPQANSLEYLAEKRINNGYPHEIIAGHCTSLGVMKKSEANRIIDKVSRAGLNIITLPSCNLYLMGRNRRGITKVEDFLKKQVNIAYASDNIRDVFHPYGNADILEEGLITAKLIQAGTPKEIKNVLHMGTYNPAKMMGLKNYGFVENSEANLVMLNAKSFHETIITQPAKQLVIKSGNLVIEEEDFVESFF